MTFSAGRQHERKLAAQMSLITAGINTGVVSVTLDLVPERPADPDTADWDDVVEASIAHVKQRNSLAVSANGTLEVPSHRQTGTVSRPRVRTRP
jgi:hypothetical protein